MTNIIQYPDPSLNVPIKELHIDEFGCLPHVHQTLKEAIEEYGAAGIAANQLGQDIRACIVQDKFLVNPKILYMGENISYEPEGCLSIEYGKKVYIRPAPTQVIVEWQDIDGGACLQTLRGFEARVALHEIRHLDGKLINEGHEHE